MSRVAFVIRRLVYTIPALLGIVVINFLMLHLSPGDVVDVMAGEAGGATPEYLSALRERFGLDQPLYLQLLLYVKNIAMLDLGYSFRLGESVQQLILERLWPTLLLTVSALVLSAGIGVLLGAIAAARVRSWVDTVISVLAVIFYATPLFWIGLMLILVFSIKLNWLPTTGMEDVTAFYEGWDRVFDIGRHLVLPAVTLSLFYLSIYTRLMRASMLEQAGMDYVVTARAKGLNEWRINARHVLPNAFLPVLTIIGVQIGSLLGGSVVVETVFAWPGLGLLAYQSLFARDLNVLLGIFLCCAGLVVLANLLVDVVYGLLDPRIDRR